MKKSIVCVLILLFLGGMFSISAIDDSDDSYVLPGDLGEDFPLDLPATGEVRDARVFALGGAFTAVSDDVNALFYNPAGLAYLNNGDLRIGGSAFFDFNSELAMNEDVLAKDIFTAIGNSDAYEYNSDDEIEYVGGGSLTEEDEDILVEQVIPMMVLHKVMDRMQLIPNVSYAGKNWGVGSSASMTVEPLRKENEDDEMHNIFQITQETGIIGGMGFDLGPAAVGVNARYFKEISTPFTFDYDPFSDLEGVDEDIMDALADDGQEEYTLEMGVGGMVTLGSLTLGTYVDNFLNIVVDESGELAEDNVLDKAWETANVGIAFEPSNRKGSQRRGLINFLAAADLNNIGDDENRVLSLGSEMGLHLGEVITMDGRVGYKQHLPGELDEIEEIININQGEITMGMGFKALFFKFDAGVSFPAVMVKHAMEFSENETGPETDEDLFDYFSEYGEHFPKFMISGGLSF
ncbi:MAG: hypothetical protein K9L75_06360 [Spirochaetia bacterium]|nr:hypothetical protein [Spirochaetia bacterium]